MLKRQGEVLAWYRSGKSLSFIRKQVKSDSATIATFLRRHGFTIRDQSFYSSGPRAWNYKGGSIQNGYRLLSVNGITQFEHRKVMEEFLKRKLLPNEHVHHLNGDKLDNRIENLAVLTPSIHGIISARQYQSWRCMYQTRIKELEQLTGALLGRVIKKPKNLGLSVSDPVPK